MFHDEKTKPDEAPSSPCEVCGDGAETNLWGHRICYSCLAPWYVAEEVRALPAGSAGGQWPALAERFIRDRRAEHAQSAPVAA